MSWRLKYYQQLEQRDAQTDHYRTYFDCFATASERAAVVDKPGPPPDLASSQLITEPAPVAALAAKDDLITALRHKLEQVESKLKVTTKELNSAQQRARNMMEEQYMKTKNVQDLYDEILALTMQLNLSEQRGEVLRKENTELIDRWMHRVSSEAGALNEANEGLKPA